MSTTTPQTTTSTPEARLPGGVDATRARSRLSMTATAFTAILQRDLVVIGREFIAFLLQVLVQPLFFLFIFGKVLPGIGLAREGFGSLLLPGIVALTCFTAALQGVTLPLTLDLGFGREIDDRLLSPMPVDLVAIEKILFAGIRGIIAGGVIFPLGFLILGSEFAVRTDSVGLLILIMVMTSLAGASVGITIGTLIKPEQIGLMFALILTPLLFTGCTYYPWASLDKIKWFQVVTLFNPLTYCAEGMRYAMVPDIHGVRLPTLEIQWVLLALVATALIFSFIGTRTFRRRVIS